MEQSGSEHWKTDAEEAETEAVRDTVEPAAEDRRLQLGAAEAVAFAALAVLLLLPGSFKVIKLLGVGGRPSLRDAVAVLAPDLVVAAATTLAVLLLFRLIGRSSVGRWVVHGALLVWLVVCVCLAVVEHQTWHRTSTLIDWSILSYTLTHFEELSVVLASETTAGGAIVVLAALLLAGLPLGVDLWRRRRTTAFEPPSSQSLVAAAVLLVLAAPGLLVHPQEPELVPLAGSVPSTLLRGAAVTWLQSPQEGTQSEAAPRVQDLLEGARLAFEPDPARPKNVVLVVLESTRADAMTVYEPELKTTPRLAELSRNGAVVEQAYAEVPHTSKALVAILCGYAPRIVFEITEAQLGGLPRPCLAHVLGHLGYQTVFFQSATATFENRGQLVANAGYEEFFARQAYDPEGFEMSNYLALEDRVMLAPLLSWMDEATNDAAARPFFVTILTTISHHNYGVPLRFPIKQLGPPERGDRYNRYLNTILYADGFVGDIVTALEERGLWDDTLLVVVGDHGQGFLEHGRKHHNDVIYEEGLRVPLLFISKRLFDARMQVGGLRRQADLAPTVLSALGVRFPEELFEGRDVLGTTGHERVYSSCWYDDRCLAERGKEIKVIDHFGKRPMEVYDIVKDPLETRDLLQVEGPEQARWQSAASEARDRMRAWRAAVNRSYEQAASERPWLRDEEPEPRYPLRARFGAAVEILGYDADTREVTPGMRWSMTLYFRCLQAAPRGYRFFIDLNSVDARLVRTNRDPAGGLLKLDQCEPGTIVADRQSVVVPHHAPAGNLDVYVGVRRRKQRLPLQVFDTTPSDSEDRLRVASLTLRPEHSPELRELFERSVTREPPPGSRRLGVRFGDALVLEDVHLEPKEARLNTSVTVTMTWRVVGPVERLPWRPFTHVHPEGKSKPIPIQHTPVGGLHPVASWEEGTWIVDRHRVLVTKRWGNGPVTLWGGLFFGRNRMPIVDAGQATVDDENRLLLGTVDVAP